MFPVIQYLYRKTCGLVPFLRAETATIEPEKYQYTKKMSEDTENQKKWYL